MAAIPEEYAAIIKRYKPRGWKVQYSYKRDKIAAESEAYYTSRKAITEEPTFINPGVSVGCTDWNKRTIYSCRPLTPYSFQVVLHEFCHVILKHDKVSTNELPSHKEEFEADHMACQIMRNEGIPITRAIRRGIARYAAMNIIADKKKGHRIRPHIKRAIQGHLTKKLKERVNNV